MSRLQVTEITKSFPHRGERLSVLQNISFSVDSGEFVAIVGPSGCGKSTLLEIVCGLQTPDAGEVRIDDTVVPSLAGQIAYMPQDDLLFPWRRIVDNVALPLVVKGVPHREARARAARLFPLFGLSGFEQAYPSQLSGGMRQRAALLRTWVNEPSVVALDEPFGALDAQTRHRLQHWLITIRQKFGSTVVLVTHDVGEALILADRIVVLSSRPATIRMDIAVDLPRDSRTVLNPKLLARKQAILEKLQYEAIPTIE